MPDVTSPEYLGSLSATPVGRQIFNNPFRAGSDKAYRWQVARDAELGKQHSLFGTNAGDHDATVKRWSTPKFYDTDAEDAA